MSGPCCDPWRATAARWCPSCGDRLASGRRSFVHLYGGGVVAVLLLLFGWRAASVATVQALRRGFNPSAALFARLARVAPSGASGANEIGDEGGFGQPPRCRLSGVPVEVGARADVASLEMAENGGSLGLGWVVPETRRGMGEGTSAASLRFDGDTLVATAQSAGVGIPVGATAHFDRVTPFPWLWPLRVASIDGVITEGLNRVLMCGDQRASLAAPVPGLAAVTSLPGGLYDCRTIALREPFYMGVRSNQAASGALDRNVSVVAFREGPWGSAPTLWSLPIDPARIRGRDPLQVGLRRAFELEGLHGVGMADGRIVIAFRYRSRLYVGRVEADLQHVAGPLQQVDTLGGEVGLPRLATDGREVLVVYADRHATPRRVRGQPPPEPGPYRLMHMIVREGVAQPPFFMSTTFAEMEDEFAPSAAALPDGSWVVTWSAGPRHPRDWTGVTQRVYLRRYRHDGWFMGGPVAIVTGGSASDSRVVSVGGRIAVAWAAGTHSTRRVVVQGGRCD